MKGYVFLFFVLSALGLPFVVYGQDGARNYNAGFGGTCEELCGAQQYEEAFACFQGRYEDTVERVKHFGDSAIIASTCAYKNGDFDVMRDVALITFVKHPFLSLVQKVAPKKGGSAHRMFLAEVAAEHLGKDASSYKENGLAYAKNSGQCEGADNVTEDEDGKTALVRCAEGYRTSIRSQLGESTGKGGGALKDTGKAYDSFELICGHNQTFDIENLTCQCRTGYKPEVKGSSTCVLNIPTEFDVGEALHFEEVIEGLKPNSSVAQTLTRADGTSASITALKQPTGRVLFTIDGKTYFDDIGTMLSPSVWSRVSGGFGSFTSAINPVNWFHVKEKDDTEGQYKELQWQIAKETLAQFKKEAKVLETEYKLFEAERKKYNGYKGWADTILGHYEGIKDAHGSIKDYGVDTLVEGLESYGATFPGAALTEFVNEAEKEVFARPVIFYIEKRREGLSKQAIQTEDFVELDVFVNESVRLTFGDEVYDRYEEAYQRFLVAREHDRTGT